MSPSVKESYDAIIKEQLDMGIIEEAPTQPRGRRTFYMPHKPVIIGIMLQARKYVWYLVLVPSHHQKHFQLMNA